MVSKKEYNELLLRLKELESENKKLKKSLIFKNKEIKPKPKPKLESKPKPKPKSKPKPEIRLKRQYDIGDIEHAEELKILYPKASIRDIGKELNISKSVIDRWLRNPEDSIRKLQAKEIKVQIPKGKKYVNQFGRVKTDTEVKESLDKFVKKIRSKPIGRQNKLTLKYSDILGFEVESL
jgi:hypothetical protein